MNTGAFLLFDLLGFARQAVDEATAGDPASARAVLDAARESAVTFTASASPEAAHAVGLLLAAASPGRYRTRGQSLLLRNALSRHALAALTAMDGARDETVRANAVAAECAMPLRRYAPAFAVVRAQICDLARSAEVTS